MRVLRRIRSLVNTHAPQPTPADGSAVVARTDKKSIFTRALQGAVVLGAGLALTVGAAGLPQAVWATEDNAEAAAEETAGAQTYTVQATSSDKTAKSAAELPVVTVDAPEGALPEGAELHAELVESEKDTEAVAGELEKADVAYDGFLALDVFFADADGNEVEPSEPVDVRFELPEGALPEGAEDLAVHHLAEAEDGTVADVEAVADDADATEGTVAVQDDATVDAEFTVESFSTFTITWGTGSNAGKVTVYYVDENGQQIDGSQTEDIENISNGDWVGLEQFAKGIEGYSFRSARLNSRSGTEAKWVRYTRNSQQRWSYSAAAHEPRQGDKVEGWTVSGSNQRRIYLVYRKNGDVLTTTSTVDSTAQGVHMYMFDYDSPAINSSIGGYNQNQPDQGVTRKGLATDKVDNNGWPSIVRSQQSFAEFFGGSQSAYDVDSAHAVNHLFLSDPYDQNGTFYYSSFENFASLKDDNDQNFTVYNQLGTPDGSDNYFYQRGNFMPYNTLNPTNIANENLYSETGKPLDSTDSRYKEPVYGLDQNANYYFGMYVWADFYQPKDGKVESNDGTSSENMIFEFNGDDDMWVYIDGVLVLDLGGIHDAQSGSINFADGTVTWTETPSKGDAADYTETTTIREQYEAAEKENSTLWDEENPNTFADGSSHRIQIFYMERGAGASNLKISFNLKTIPDGQLAVSKDVENFYDPQVKDIEYTMQVEVWDSIEKKWVPYAGKDYSLFEKEGDGTTDSKGQFKIKYGDTAIFTGIDVGTKVRVKEVGVSETPDGSSISDAYNISYVVKDNAGQDIAGSQTEGSTEDNTGYAVASMPAYGGIDVTVTNKATYTRPLKVVKKFSGTEGNEAPAGFEATYTLYEVDESGNKLEPAIGSVKYSGFTNGEYVFWLDTDKNYTVEETFGGGDNKAESGDTKWQKVTVETNNPAEGTKASDGIVSLDENDATEGKGVDTITLTNVYGPSDLTIKNVLRVTKTMHGHDLKTGMFDFTVVPKDWNNGKPDDEKIEVSAQEAAEKAGLQLESGVYAYSNSGSAEEDAAGLARMGNQITFSADDIGKTYVYEYAEEEDVHSSDLETNDVAYDGSQFRIELAVSEAEGDIQVEMSKYERDSESGDWGEPVEVTITRDNCTGEENSPLMTIGFENSVSKADLSITKRLEQGSEEHAPEGAQFTIQIELKDEGGEPITGKFGAMIGDQPKNVSFNEKGIGIVTLKAGETIVINDLPVGAKYKVTEPESTMPGGFELSWIDKTHDLDSEVEGRAANMPWCQDEIGIDDNDVTVNNWFVGYGLEVYKGVAKDQGGTIVADPNSPLPGAQFTVYQVDGVTEMNVKSICTEENIYQNMRDETETDGYVTFGPFAAGTYYFKETRVPSGYQLMKKVVQMVVSVDKDGTPTATFQRYNVDEETGNMTPDGSSETKNLETANDENLGKVFKFDVANKPNPDLPQSGSSGTLIMSSVGVATIILAGVYLLNRRFPLSK